MAGKDQYTYKVYCINCGEKYTAQQDIGESRPVKVKCRLCECTADTTTLDKNYENNFKQNG